MRNEGEDPSLKGVGAAFSRHAKSFDTTPRPGFREALLMRLREARKHPMPSFSFSSLLSGRRGAFAGAGVTALVLIIAISLVLQPFYGVQVAFAQDNFTLTPEHADAAGIDPATTYLLQSKDPVRVEDVQEDFASNTDVAFEMTQVDEHTIRVAFAEPLAESDIVKFTLATRVVENGQTTARPYGWAFQVKAPLRVENTLPGLHATYVPLDTGIEVTFNYENLSVEDVQNAMSIEPAVSGHVEQFRRTFVFVPDEPLQPETRYTVTIRGGLGLQGSDEVLAEDYVYDFETGPAEYRGLDFGTDEKFMSVVPGGTLSIPVHRWGGRLVGYDEWGNPIEEAIDEPVKVVAYRFPDFDTYLAALEGAQDTGWQAYVQTGDVADLTTLTAAVTFEGSFMQDDQSGGYKREVVAFPEPLGAGYYLVDLSYGGRSAWTLVSVSPLVTYVARGVDRTLMWVNSSETRGPVSGATVGYVNDVAVQTDAQGLAYAASREDQSSVVTVRSGAEAMAVVLTGSVWIEGQGEFGWDSRPRSMASQDYWSYVYTDRPMYKTSDTVHFWGALEHRESGAHPSHVTVAFGTLDEMTIPVSENGTFTGSMSLSNMSPGYYELTVQDGDTTVVRRSLTVQEYVKPAYTLSITPDRLAAFAGEEVGYMVHGALFEGTPMKGLEVTVELDWGVHQQLTLDASGNARGSFTKQPDRNPMENWQGHRYPEYSWLRAYPTRPEEGRIEATASVAMFGPRIYLDIPYEGTSIENGTGQVQVVARNVAPMPTWDAQEFAPTTRSGVQVQGKLTEITYNRIEEGTSYDFIRKVTVPNYSYQRVETEVQNVTLTTGADGAAVFTFAAANPNANYEVRFLAYDEFGMPDTAYTYVWQKQGYENYLDQSLRFNNDDAPEADPWSFVGYGVGDQVHLSVHQGTGPFVMPEGSSFLFFQAHQGVQEATIAKQAQYVFPFEQRDVPNVGVYGVLFAGDAYAQVGSGWWWGSYGYDVSYDTSLSELAIEITPGRDAYKPGETVDLAVRVTDKNGNPVAANVNINVVDEAFYALMPEDVDPLGALYARVSDGIEATKVSAELHMDALMAEGGGGGGDARVDFRDTGAFMEVRTGADGRASASFTLPDDITSWRVTAQAIDLSQKLAGDTKINVDASLPFFILPVLRESYLDADQPSIYIRAAGTDVGGADPVTYTVRIESAGVEEQIESTVGASVAYALPDLALGAHDIDIEANSGSLRDRVVRTVNIVESRLVRPVVSRVELGEGEVIGAPRGYTTVTFIDGNRGQYYADLELLANTWGDRADEAAVRVVATQVLNDAFGEAREEPSLLIGTYQSGMAIQLLPYADPDLDLTARMALLQETPFNEASMIQYFENGVYSPREAGTAWDRSQVAKAYAALAALGEPVLAEVQRLAQEGDLSQDERLSLALALHFSGDDEGARVIYRELVREAKSLNGYLLLQDDDIETTGERTAQLAILAAALNEPQRDILYDYLVQQPTGDSLQILERLIFIREALPHVSASDAVVSYMLEGERRSETLVHGASVSIDVSPDELATLDARAEQGTVIAVSRFVTPILDLDAPVTPELSIERVYKHEDGSTGNTFAEGERVRIELNYDLPVSNCGRDRGLMPCDVYEITDILPSGLVPATPVYAPYFSYESVMCEDSPISSWDQRQTFLVYPGTGYEPCAQNQVVYYARVVTAGVYEAEPVYIRSTRDPDTHNHSASSDFITITE